jgi:aspartyl-tRNA(Asn)/glutamyl-tRNA(Gln) amidotransferase subunit A
MEFEKENGGREMTQLDAYDLTVSEASRLIRANELSPSELLESVLRRIDKLESKLQAWVTIDQESVKATAEQYSTEAAKGHLRGPLHGIPIGIKDIFFTAGMKTTAGSKILANFIPDYSASTVTRLKAAGAIVLGKTETTEFADFDPAATRNPWNLNHTPGGSSSGSAAAVSAGMCPTSLGSQTGGSTIRPAAYCGIVGLKPTYGRISRFGMIPLSWSLDHVGIFTRTVKDAALLLEILAGHDPKDTSSSTLPVPPYSSATDNTSPPRLALLKEYFWDNATKEVRENIVKVSEHLKASGAKVVEQPLPESFNVVNAAYWIMKTTEEAAVHEENFQTRMDDYGPIISQAIATGLLLPPSAYLKVLRIRGRVIREMATALQAYDCFITPATTDSPPKGLGSTGNPTFNSPWSFCGFPAITIPTSVTRDGLPLGIQLVSRPFDEKRLISVASWCEKTLQFGHAAHNPV